jgi:carbonic anhydrase/acetyltransferase-like protein (isoleucine patch superfamily)
MFLVMLIEHNGKVPTIDPTARIAPTAVICGDVTICAGTSDGFGAVLTAETGPITIGSKCLIMENAVLRGTKRHPLSISNNVLVGPHAHLTGCTVAENVFVATRVSIFNGASLGERSLVRIGAIVHFNSRLEPGDGVPIGWIAAGNPAQMFRPDQHEEMWKVLGVFAKTVWGLDPAAPGGTIMPVVVDRYTRALARHQDDRILDCENNQPHT